MYHHHFAYNNYICLSVKINLLSEIATLCNIKKIVCNCKTLIQAL
jgi:hypothetical protein